MNSTKMIPDKSTGFTGLDTKAIKGIAVIVMLFHHMAGFPERLPAWFSGFSGAEYVKSFSSAAWICIVFFCFLGGYGLYLRWKDGKFSVVNAVLGLYQAYWKVFVFFVPLGILFFSGYEGSRYGFTTVSSLITRIVSDFLGLSCEFNMEWWFLRYYICVLPMGVIFCHLTKRLHNVWCELFVVFLWDIVMCGPVYAFLGTQAGASVASSFFYASFFRNASLTGAFFAGVVCAKYDGICRIKRLLQEQPCPVIVCTVGLGMLVWCRTFILKNDGDMIYCMMMIPMLSVLLDRLPRVKKACLFLGKHSTNLWLIHSFYCYYFPPAARLVYCSSNVLVDLLVLTIITLASSMLLNLIYSLPARLHRYQERS